MKFFKSVDGNAVPSNNAVIYNILIDTLCKKKDVEAAMRLVDEMRKKGVPLNCYDLQRHVQGTSRKEYVGGIIQAAGENDRRGA